MSSMKKLLNFRPILFASISLIVGILIAFFIITEKAVLSYVIMGVFLTIILSWIIVILIQRHNVKESIIFACIFAVFLCVGTLFTFLSYNKFTSAKIGGEEVTITATVDSVEPIENGQYLVLDNVILKSENNQKLDYKIIAYYYGNKEFRLGYTIDFNAFMSDTNDYYEGNLQIYNIVDGTRYRVNLNDNNTDVIDSNPNVFQTVNLFIKDTLEDGMGKDEYPIAYALICGNSEWMEADVISSYRRTGVAHIFAVSGLHIGFLALVLNFLFSKCKIKGYLKAILTTCFLLFYVGVCGFTASSIRAMIMSAIMLFASASGKKYDSLSAISFASIIVLLISPFQFFSAGYQLSFGISTGIIILFTPIFRLLKFLPKKLASGLAVGISAQLVGIPIMLIHFGEISLISIIINMILVPIVSGLYIAIFIGVILSAITTVPFVFLFLQKYCIVGINWLIKSIDYQFFLVGGISLGVLVIIYFAVLLITSGFFNIGKIKKCFISVGLSVLFIVGTVIYNVTDFNALKVYVIGEQSFQGAVVSTGKEDLLLVNYVNDNFSGSRLKRVLNKLRIDGVEEIIFLKTDDGEKAYIKSLNVLSVVQSEKISYCGKFDAVEYGVLKQLFPNIDVSIIENDKTFTVNGTEFNIFADGYCVEITKGNSNILLVSRIEKAPLVPYQISGKFAKYLVFSDCIDKIDDLIFYEKAIAYLQTDGYGDAQNNGNFLIKIN
ncbi:MAG: ComEC/Rec2 family competence protein [Clostridiales bacterium]|nr:ComEC/Rec2 family competence protein [Clostridiales bacterium]